MDVVETITFTRQGLNASGDVISTTAVYVCGSDDQRPRDEWSQEQIDAIGENLVADMDKNLTERFDHVLN